MVFFFREAGKGLRRSRPRQRRGKGGNYETRDQNGTETHQQRTEMPPITSISERKAQPRQNQGTRADQTA